MTDMATPESALLASPKTKRRMMRSLTVQSDGPNVALPSRWIPVPDIPIWPVLSPTALLNQPNSLAASILDAGSSVYVMAGRVAIGLALRLAGLAEGDKVLLPAFHCTSMVEPLSCVSASPVFYRVNADLSVDIEDIACKIDSSTRALIATNYFGFPQDLQRLRRFCDDNDLVFIEDCAHSFFGEFGGRPLGSYGHYAIGSLTKFFPVKEGGCLISSDPKINELAMHRRGFQAEFRQLYASIEDAIYCHRLTFLGPMIRALETARRLRPSRTSKSQNERRAVISMNELDQFDPNWLDIEASGVSKWISRFASAGQIAKRRRENFRRILSHFSERSDCRPLITHLPEGVVPYMFPLWIDNLEAVFARLEDLAVPVQRFGQFLWPGIDENVCRNSADFSKHLIQLPCHQELRDHEINWMLETVGEVIASSRR